MEAFRRHGKSLKPVSVSDSTSSDGGGYSLPEVMIASTLLALVVTNSVVTLTQSGKTFGKSRERDAISALIAKDLEGLRAIAFNYMRHALRPGTSAQ